MSYIVTAPLVIIRDSFGASHHLYQGAPVPDGMDKDHLKQLVDGEMVEKVKGSEATAPENRSDKIDDILTDVGEDQVKAVEALEREQAKGDKARPTLVEKLQAIANPAS